MVFNKPVDIIIEKKQKDMFVTSFIINNIKYIFKAKIKNKEAVLIFYPLDGDPNRFKRRNNNINNMSKIIASLIESIRIMMLKENYFFDITRIVFTSEYSEIEKICSNKIYIDKVEKTSNLKLQNSFRDRKGRLSYIYKGGVSDY